MNNFNCDFNNAIQLQITKGNKNNPPEGSEVLVFAIINIKNTLFLKYFYYFPPLFQKLCS